MGHYNFGDNSDNSDNSLKIPENDWINVSSREIDESSYCQQNSYAKEVNVQCPIDGLPVYDKAAKLGMKQIWPFCAAITAMYLAGLFLANPFFTGQRERAKGKHLYFN